MMPSEFKENWKELVTEKIIDGFANFYDHQFIFVILVQMTFRIWLEKVSEIISKKSQGILKYLKIDNDCEQSKHLDSKLIKLFTDFELLIFKPDDTYYAEVKETLILQIKINMRNSNYEHLIWESDDGIQITDDLEDMIHSDEFLRCLDSMYALAVNMKLNNPPITLELLEFDQIKRDSYSLDSIEFLSNFQIMKFNKAKYEWIDGFPKEKELCLQVLNAPKKWNSSLLGIKPSVVMLDKENITDKITNIAEEFELSK